MGRRNMVNTEERADAADRADDLIPEESELMQRALKRLSPKESYDRVFRMRRAFQVHFRQQAPKNSQDPSNRINSALLLTSSCPSPNGPSLKMYVLSPGSPPNPSTNHHIIRLANLRDAQISKRRN